MGPKTLRSLWHFMCTATGGYKKEASNPSICYRYIKQLASIFCTWYKNILFARSKVSCYFFGNLLLRENPFHIVNCLRSFDFTSFFVWTSKLLRCPWTSAESFPGGKHQQFAHLFQCEWRSTKRFLISTPQRKCPMLWQESQKCASLAAIARYIGINYTIRYQQFST